MDRHWCCEYRCRSVDSCYHGGGGVGRYWVRPNNGMYRYCGGGGVRCYYCLDSKCQGYRIDCCGDRGLCCIGKSYARMVMMSQIINYNIMIETAMVMLIEMMMMIMMVR